MAEEWRPVPGFEGQYEVSSGGRVRSCARRLPFLSKRGQWCVRVTAPRLLAVQRINSGYAVVHLHHENIRRARTVHSLVAAAFIGPRPKGYDVAHRDGDRQHNAVSNLRYATRSENHADKRAHGTLAAGSRIRQAKLTEAGIPTIRSLRGVMPAVAVGRVFGVGGKAIGRIWNGETWAHVGR